MSNFFDKYQLTEAKKSSTRVVSHLSPQERVREKLIQAVDEQLALLDLITRGQDISTRKGDKLKKPRLFWADVPGGFFFTPRFGNDFIFEKGSGIFARSPDELKALLIDFQTAVSNSEFDSRATEIASTRKGRGAGVKRKQA